MRIGAETLAAYVETHPGITPDALADYIGVSVRTVRTYVNQINRAMNGFAAIKLNRKSGYHMEISDPYAYDTWREEVGRLRRRRPRRRAWCSCSTICSCATTGSNWTT